MAGKFFSCCSDRRTADANSSPARPGPQNLALLGIFEAFKTILALRPGPVFDVGVNLGQTLLKIKALDWTREYVGFEINPRCVVTTSTH